MLRIAPLHRVLPAALMLLCARCMKTLKACQAHEDVPGWKRHNDGYGGPGCARNSTKNPGGFISLSQGLTVHCEGQVKEFSPKEEAISLRSEFEFMKWVM